MSENKKDPIKEYLVNDQDKQSKYVKEQTITEGLKNIKFIVILTSIFYVSGLFFNILGKVGFWLLTFLAAINLLRILYLIILQLISIFAPSGLKLTNSNLIQSMIFQITESIIYLGLSYLLYLKFIN